MDPASAPTAAPGAAPVRRGQAWVPRRGAALACAAVLRGVPVAAAAVSSVVAGQLLPRPDGLAVLGWWAALALVAQMALRLVERAVRRLLPLSQLLGLSLVFPDRAPSRFAVALRMGNVERLQRDVDRAVVEGLPTDLDEACILALQLVRMVSEHDRGTRGHSDRVRAYAELLAEELGLSADERDRLRWGALLHDVGKLAVPREILNKPGRPSDEEWEVLRRHPLEGGRIIAPLADWLGDAVAPASQHHERWDGRGYPLGLAGEEIARTARIVAVADALAVMTGARAYKKPQPMDVARREVASAAGSQFDPEVSRALLAVSIGRLSRAAGPFATLCNVPFLGNVAAGAAELPATVTTVAAAAGMTAASVVAPQVALPDRWTGAPTPAVSVLGTTVTRDTTPDAATDTTVAGTDPGATTTALDGVPVTDGRAGETDALALVGGPIDTGSAGAALRAGTTAPTARPSTTVTPGSTTTRVGTSSTVTRSGTTTTKPTATLGGAVTTAAGATASGATTTVRTATDTTKADATKAESPTTVASSATTAKAPATSAPSTAGAAAAPSSAVATSAATTSAAATTAAAPTVAATTAAPASTGRGVAGENANTGGNGNNTGGTRSNSSGDNVNARGTAGSRGSG